MKRILAFTLTALMSVGAAGQDHLGRAKVALSSGDTTTAVSALQDALKAGQKPAEANLQLGTIALSRGKIDDAITYLQSAVRADDENVGAWKLLGDAHLAKKDVARALEQYRRGERLAKRDPDVLTAYGLALIQADSVDASIAKLTLAKEYDPSRSAIYIGLAEAYMKQNVAVLGISNYQKAIELNPKDVKTRFALAQLFEKQRQWNDAVREYDGVVALDSGHAQAYLAKGNILTLAKQYARALPPLVKYRELRPGSVEGSALYAKALFGANQWKEAAEAAKYSLQLDSSNVDVWRIYAHSLTELREYKNALTGFSALQRRNALESEDQAAYGNALYGLGLENEAMTALLNAMAADSTNCEPYFNLGSLYMRKRDYVSAAAMFEKRLACDPRSLSSYINAAACYLQIKNFSRARELLLTGVELKSDFLAGRLWLARYYTMVDSLELAKQQYDEVLAQIGANTDKYRREAGEAHYLTGAYYFARQQYVRAIDSYRRASALNYETAELHLSWGQAVLQTLDPKNSPEENRKTVDDGIRHFRRSLELEPSSAVTHLWLAQALVLARIPGEDEENKRLQEEACAEYRKVLRIDPNNDDAKKGMTRISCPGAGQ